LKVKKIVKGKAVRKVAAKPAAVNVSLPTERSKPLESLADYSILIYGTKKIGKTTLGSMFAKALFLLFEPGGKALAIFERPILNWIEFKEYIKLLIKDKKFDNVIVDTGDVMYEQALEYVCKKLVISHPADEDWGKGWKALKQEITKEVYKLLNSGKGVIFISHSKEEEIKTRGGDKFNRTTSTMSGQAKELLEGVVDIWAYYAYEKDKRVLYILGDDYIDAGHRIEGRFLYPDGTPIKKIPMGNSKEEAYKNFVLAFENRLPKPTASTVVPKKKGKIKLKTK